MDIGKRLRQLRLARGLSQGDIERRTGLMRSYVSRVEGGFTQPTIETLERWAKALGLELYQVFYTGKGKPKAARLTPSVDYGSREGKFVRVYRDLASEDQRFLLALARNLKKRGRGRG